MQDTAGGWKIFDAEMPIMTCEYSFGPGTANALAIGGEHGLIVVSPPWKADDALCDALSPYGPVVAIVASNAFHHLGLPEWKRRFPQAAVYAPAQSLARVERKTRITGIRPLADAAGVAGHAVELIDMPHYKTGEALVRMKSSRGLAWYVTDFMMNMTVLPANPLARLIFKVTNSAPGLKFNNITPLFMVQDKAALKRWLAAEFDKAPPQWIIPAHGDIAAAGPARALFGAS
ncbi:MAG TPA: MBL fold metallo-hydrolase [Burkholderiales bacterium]|nr:MBL fold metallo-hydrolase [Burkholderiales bacterium]